MKRSPLFVVVGAGLAVALTGCAAGPSSATDLLKTAKGAGVSCANPTSDNDTSGADSVVCGDLEMWYFKTDKARSFTVKLLAAAESSGLVEADPSEQVLLGDHFAAHGPKVQVQQLQEKTGGTIYATTQAPKHL